MLARQPDNALVRFGLANELLKVRQFEDVVQELALYLEQFDDEGNGWLRYADALRQLGRSDDARAAIDKGVAAAERFRHATLVGELEALREELD
jgi:predicted Zn-dependent protease